MRDFLFDDLSLFHGSKIVGSSPMLRTVIVMQVIITGFEGLESHVCIAEKLEDHLIKVVAAAVNWQVRSPVVLDPLKHHLLARFDRTDLIRSAGQCRGKGCPFEIVLFPIMPGQDGDRTDHQG